MDKMEKFVPPKTEVDDIKKEKASKPESNETEPCKDCGGSGSSDVAFGMGNIECKTCGGTGKKKRLSESEKIDNAKF